jgi:hypothetical protein
MIGPWEIILLLLLVVPMIPAYVVAERRGVISPAVAFVPLVGPYIVILWSIDRSGWLCILGVIPLIAVVFGIWLAFVVPAEHGRTRWWALPFLIPLFQFVAFFAYAFTLQPIRPQPGLAA